MKKNLLVIFAILVVLTGCRKPYENHSSEGIDKVKTDFNNPPEWSKEVVWYQIFVERFRNGDKSNDPTKEDIQGSYPGYIPENWQVTPWTQDWYKEDAYFQNLEGHKDFGGYPIKGFSMKTQLRRYGGDLQGVLDKMDYLKSLGITAVYFNPLNDAPSLHKYDARYWRHIDRNFGPNPRMDVETMKNEDPLDPATWKFTEADKMFLKVIDEFHKRGIKVILDYSWNHTGHTFWAWKDLVKNQADSKYKDWYWVKKFDDPKTEENEFEYRGWFGVFDLPEIKETEYIDHSDGIVPAEGNIFSQQVKDLIFNITKRWLDPNGDGNPSDGVDGYRLDVAAEVPFGFWREYRKLVRSINPDAFLLGEVWWEVWPDRLLDPAEFVEGDIFDAPMNYRWYRSARHFFNASPNEIPVSEFIDSLKSYSSNIRKENNYAMMNLVASHDVPRVLTSLYNKNKYKYNCKPEADAEYKINKPDQATYETLKLLLAHQYTYVGSPSIWAGDEMGMWGADDPSTRKPLIWEDYSFENESAHPLGEKRPIDEVKFDKDLFKFYQKMISMRNEQEVLKKGEIDFILVDDVNKVLAYSRYNNENEVIAVFNTSSEEKVVELNTRQLGHYTDIIENQKLKTSLNKIKVKLQPRSFAILSNS